MTPVHGPADVDRAARQGTPLTLQKVRAELQAIGVTIRSHNGEYEVRCTRLTPNDPVTGYTTADNKPRQRRKQTVASYFTNDLGDARVHGLALALWVNQRHEQQPPGSSVSTMQVATERAPT